MIELHAAGSSKQVIYGVRSKRRDREIGGNLFASCKHKRAGSRLILKVRGVRLHAEPQDDTPPPKLRLKPAPKSFCVGRKKRCAIRYKRYLFSFHAGRNLASKFDAYGTGTRNGDAASPLEHLMGSPDRRNEIGHLVRVRFK